MESFNFKNKKQVTMVFSLSLKLVLRSWWKSKAFALISIVSLSIGITCTLLLATFVIHEYNVEKGNPGKEYIYLLSQDHPMSEGERVAYIYTPSLLMMQQTLPEVETILQLELKDCYSVFWKEKQFTDVSLVKSSPDFTEFFPFEMVAGNLEEVLKQPGQVALSDPYAKKIFGKENPLNQRLEFRTKENETISLEVTAIFKEREQSLISIDLLTAGDITGGVSFLKTNQIVDKKVLEEKIKNSNIPTLQVDKGRYYLYTLQEAYFDNLFKHQSYALGFINQRQIGLLKIGMFSALLILAIACFNYVNLTFSRILQQLKMIHTQKLMGATTRMIRQQLFIDTSLTVVIAFLFSLLLIHDFLPSFNSIVTGKLKMGFLFDLQMFPVILLLIALLIIIPALYVSQKLSGLSGNDYRIFFTGKKKRKIVSLLVILQFTFSIGLTIAFITVNRQMNLAKTMSAPYKNLITIGDPFGPELIPFYQQMSILPEVTSVSKSIGSILNAWLKQHIFISPNGTETSYPVLLLGGDELFFDTMNFKLLEGDKPSEAKEKYPASVYINKKYVEKIIPQGENPVGKPLRFYDKEFLFPTDSIAIIAGIVENLPINSIEEEMMPTLINLRSENNFIHLRLNSRNKAATLQKIKTIWESIYPEQYFTFQDVEQDFLKRNSRIYEMSNLLLLYSLISVFLTCFGLFGMALYATQQRKKEITIRKVNGATTIQLIKLLIQEFVWWIGIGAFIAIPSTWILLNRWLENFVYRVNISFTTISLTLLFILCVTLLTVIGHSYKAANLNPVNSLKNE